KLLRQARAIDEDVEHLTAARFEGPWIVLCYSDGLQVVRVEEDALPRTLWNVTVAEGVVCACVVSAHDSLCPVPTYTETQPDLSSEPTSNEHDPDPAHDPAAAPDSAAATPSPRGDDQTGAPTAGKHRSQESSAPLVIYVTEAEPSVVVVVDAATSTVLHRLVIGGPVTDLTSHVVPRPATNDDPEGSQEGALPPSAFPPSGRPRSGIPPYGPPVVEERVGVLVVSSHRTLHLYDLKTWSWMVSLGTGASPVAPPKALQARTPAFWYESASGALILYSWWSGRVLGRAFVDQTSRGASPWVAETRTPWVDCAEFSPSSQSACSRGSSESFDFAEHTRSTTGAIWADDRVVAATDLYDDHVYVSFWSHPATSRSAADNHSAATPEKLSQRSPMRSPVQDVDGIRTGLGSNLMAVCTGPPLAEIRLIKRPSSVDAGLSLFGVFKRSLCYVSEKFIKKQDLICTIAGIRDEHGFLTLINAANTEWQGAFAECYNWRKD
ncbi:hypothetical protein GNI_044850, partial [Gregarina niphandrodes]